MFVTKDFVRFIQICPIMQYWNEYLAGLDAEGKVWIMQRRDNKWVWEPVDNPELS
jgi:hypothetical protein